MVQPIQYPGRDPNTAMNAARGALDLQTATQQLQMMMLQQEAAQREQLLAQQKADYFQSNPLDVSNPESLQQAAQFLAGAGDFKGAGDISGIGAQQASANKDMAQTQRIKDLAPFEKEKLQAQAASAGASAAESRYRRQELLPQQAAEVAQKAKLRELEVAEKTNQMYRERVETNQVNMAAMGRLIEAGDYQSISDTINTNFGKLKEADPAAWERLKADFLDLDDDGTITSEELQQQLEGEDRATVIGLLSGLTPAMTLAKEIVDRTKKPEERAQEEQSRIRMARLDQGIKVANENTEKVQQMGQKLDTSERLLALLSDPEAADTGILANFNQFMSQAGAVLGGTGKEAQSLQEIQGIMNELMLTTVEKLPGPISNFETQNMQKVVGSITDEKGRLQATANLLNSKILAEKIAREKVLDLSADDDNLAALPQTLAKEFASIPTIVYGDDGTHVFFNEFFESRANADPSATEGQILEQWRQMVKEMSPMTAQKYGIK